jgi:hypothetical protein
MHREHDATTEFFNRTEQRLAIPENWDDLGMIETIAAASGCRG